LTKLAEFYFSLDRNLEDVNDFYNKKFGDASRRLKLLQDRYGTSPEALQSLDRNDLEELMGALLDLRGQLRKLQWFGEVNRRGFIKITKKMDKKVAHNSQQAVYLQTKVDTKPFATNNVLGEAMKLLNEWLSTLGETKENDDAASVHSDHHLQRVSSRSIFNLPPGQLLGFFLAWVSHGSCFLIRP
jgi:glycerophosphodiester phosphodiesterase